jgi:hypothetical protein
VRARINLSPRWGTPGLADRAPAARAADASTEAEGGPVGTAPAVTPNQRTPRDRHWHSRPVDPRQPALVVAHAKQGTKEHSCRDSDKPDSKENQPKSHALPLIAYGHLYRMVQQPQNAVLVSSRTVRRNPARPRAEMAPGPHGAGRESALNAREADVRWLPGCATSLCGTGQSAASGLLLYLEHLGLPARAPGKSGCRSTHTLERRSSFHEASSPPAVRR